MKSEFLQKVLTQKQGSIKNFWIMKVKSFEMFESLSSRLTQVQVDWCNKYIDGEWKVNSRREIEVRKHVSFKNRNFNRIPVKFAPMDGNFDCNSCTSLTSLEGVPSSVGGDFYCMGCTKLTSLKDAPSSVGRSFYCISCTSLTSLAGAPSSVGKDFYCSGCESLTSLEGAPSSVGGDFYCTSCTSLISIEGIPSLVSGDFHCDGCTSLPLEQIELASDSNLLKKWLKSGISIKEFLLKNRGLIAGKKFGL